MLGAMSQWSLFDDDADDDDDDGDDDMYMMSVCTDLIFVKTFTRPEFFGAKILHENA